MRRRALALIVAGLALCVARTGHAQMPVPNGSLRPDSSGAQALAPSELGGAALEGPVDPATYVLGPGDGLMLEVLGRVTMSVGLEVDPEGNVWIPDVGAMHIAGRTLTEARTQLQHSFHGGARGLEVSLRLVRLRRIVVYVEGEVASPGALRTTAVTRVSEAVRQAGGLTQRGSRRNLRILGENDSMHTADLLRFERLGDRAANPYLKDGDRVLVPIARLPVYLHAPVPYPGTYEFVPGEDLNSLLAVAGGLLPSAVPERGRILRFRDARAADTLDVDVAQLVASHGALALAEGDRVFIPSNSEYHQDRSVIVRGEVVHPGSYPIEEGKNRVSDALAEAGGLTADASTTGILIVRRRVESAERDPEFDRLTRLSRNEMTDVEYQTLRTKLAFAQNTFRVDVESAAGRSPKGAAGKTPLARDVELQEGDVVLVERKSLSVMVSGEVRLPGLVEYEPTREGREYIDLAGGLTNKAKAGGIRLTRVATGQTLLLKDANKVEAGDLIYVPDKREVNWFAVLRDAVALATSLATLIVVSRK